MKDRKKVWELQHQTACKVIGMAFDLSDLKKIAERFGISTSDSLMDQEFVLHSTCVHMCNSDNKVSRRIQKMIEARFARYAKRLAAREADQLIDAVIGGKEPPDIPLWAILWELSTRGLEKGSAVETALFGYIHMLEHRLMRDFWATAARRAQERELEKKALEDEVNLRRAVLDLRRDLERSEKMNDQLRVRLSEMENSRGRQTGSGTLLAAVDSQRTDQAEKIQRLQTLLEETRAQKQSLEEECLMLNRQLGVLASEASQKSVDTPPEIKESEPFTCPCPEFLGQRRVAMIGGIDSLEAHYRDLVEAMGGTFLRHDGHCRNGECPIQDCVRKADLVVCPVDVNSHNAVKSVKKLCKKYGVPCCFPRTAGINGLRSAIEEHFSESRVA